MSSEASLHSNIICTGKKKLYKSDDYFYSYEDFCEHVKIWKNIIFIRFASTDFNNKLNTR